MGASFTKTTWVDASSPYITAAQLNRMETGIYASASPLVSSLPASPIDGQECQYVADATNGVVWHLVYRSADASAYKWNFIGGTALGAQVATLESTASTSYVALTTAGPSITTPLAGDYVVEHGTGGYNNNAGGGGGMSFDIGGSAAADASAVWFGYGGTANVGNQQSSRRQVLTGVAVSTAIVAKYRVNASGTANFFSRWLALCPVRVG